ncbi:hypothetical protein HPB47_021153, partial [Ixodes persulcatus]
VATVAHAPAVASYQTYHTAPAVASYAHAAPVYGYGVNSLGYGAGHFGYGHGLGSYGLNYGYGLGTYGDYTTLLRKKKSPAPNVLTPLDVNPPARTVTSCCCGWCRAVASYQTYHTAPAVASYAHAAPVYGYGVNSLGYGAGHFGYGHGLGSYGLNYGYGLGTYGDYTTLLRKKKCKYMNLI